MSEHQTSTLFIDTQGGYPNAETARALLGIVGERKANPGALAGIRVIAAAIPV